jgi:protein TonB
MEKSPLTNETIDAQEARTFRRALVTAVIFHAAILFFIVAPKQADSGLQALAVMEFDVYDPLGGEPGGLDEPYEEPEPEEPEPEPDEEPPVMIESVSEEAEVIAPPPPPLPKEDKPKPKPRPKPVQAGPPSIGPPGTGLGGSGGGTGRGNPSALGAYKAKVQRKLERYKKYPPRARSERQEGTATVRFTINRNGQVVRFELIKSSGYPILDDEVAALLRRVAPLPELPAEIPDPTVTLTAPIQFALR